jgi:hypothetical protein
MKSEHEFLWKEYGMYCEQDVNGVLFRHTMGIGVKFIDDTKLDLIGAFGLH